MTLTLICNQLGGELEDNIDYECYGDVGKLTHLKDIEGNELYVGDIVEIHFNNRGWKDLVPVVECNGSMFVMGLKGLKQDVLISEWKIKRVKSYKELSVGFTGVGDGFTGVGDFYVIEGKCRSTDIKGALLDKDFNLNTIRDKLLDFVNKHSE